MAIGASFISEQDGSGLFGGFRSTGERRISETCKEDRGSHCRYGKIASKVDNTHDFYFLIGGSGLAPTEVGL